MVSSQGASNTGDQIRYVVNELGRIVFNHDTAVRTAAMSHFDDGAAFSLPVLPVDRRKGVLYIEILKVVQNGHDTQVKMTF